MKNTSIYFINIKYIKLSKQYAPFRNRLQIEQLVSLFKFQITL